MNIATDTVARIQNEFNNKRRAAALDIVYDVIDRLLFCGEYKNVKLIIAEIIKQDFPLSVFISILVLIKPFRTNEFADTYQNVIEASIAKFPAKEDIRAINMVIGNISSLSDP